jgi:hypothetical protein
VSFYEAAVEINPNLRTIVMFLKRALVFVVIAAVEATSGGFRILLFALGEATVSPAQGVIRWG